MVNDVNTKNILYSPSFLKNIPQTTYTPFISKEMLASQDNTSIYIKRFVSEMWVSLVSSYVCPRGTNKLFVPRGQTKEDTRHLTKRFIYIDDKSIIFYLNIQYQVC